MLLSTMASPHRASRLIPVFPQQFLYDSSNLDENAWEESAAGVSIDDSGEFSAITGSSYFTITTLSTGPFWGIQLVNSSMAGQRLNYQAKTKDATLAQLRLWAVNSSSSTLGRVDVVYNLSNDTIDSVIDDDNIISQEDDTSASIFIQDLGGGEKLISFTIGVPANTYRIHAGLHLDITSVSTKYTDVNLSVHDNDGVAPFAKTNNIHSTPYAPDLLAGEYIFNPGIHNDYDVWKPGDIDSITFDATHNVATSGQLATAIATAEATPSQNHKIQWTTNSLSEDINETLTADFISAGGVLVITSADGEYWSNSGQLRFNGGEGCVLHKYKCTKEFSQYDIDGRDSGVYYGLSIFQGKWAIIDHQNGNGFEVDGDPLLSCIGIVHISNAVSADDCSLYVEKADLRNTTTGISCRGAAKRCVLNSVIIGTLEDEYYMNNNTTSSTNAEIHLWMQNIYSGLPASTRISVMCVNTRNEAWATGGFEPFVEGEIVTQTSPDGVMRSTVKHIYLGDGAVNAPRMHTAIDIAGTGTGWKGDVVYLEYSDDSETYLHEGYAAVGATSAASFTPTKQIRGGASTEHDCGPVEGVIHSDGLQFGASNDDANTHYHIARTNINSDLSTPLGGYTTGILPNFGTGYNCTMSERFVDVCALSQHGSYASTGNYRAEDGTQTRASLGTQWERDHSDNYVNYTGTNPTTTVDDPLRSYDAAPYINNIVSGNRSAAFSVIDNAINNDNDWYPYKYSITESDSTELTTSVNYEDLFGTTLARYSDDEAFENRAYIPYNAPFETVKKLICNWFDFYRAPVWAGGFDYTTTLSGSGIPPKGFHGETWAAGRIPHIRFTDWYEQTISTGGPFVAPGFTATDGETDLTGSVTVDTSGVDVDTTGIYYPRYHVTNSDGNTYETWSVLTVE